MGSEQGTSGTITGLLGDIVDDTMHFVDDLMDRANNFELDTRSAVTDLVDAGGDEMHSTPDMAALQATLADLQHKVERLTALKAQANQADTSGGTVGAMS